VVVRKIVGAGFRHECFRYPARGRLPFGPGEDVKRLNDLERKNVTLKRFLADVELEKVALKEIVNGNI
jgi:hypothetical protein